MLLTQFLSFRARKNVNIFVTLYDTRKHINVTNFCHLNIFIIIFKLFQLLLIQFVDIRLLTFDDYFLKFKEKELRIY